MRGVVMVVGRAMAAAMAVVAAPMATVAVVVAVAGHAATPSWARAMKSCGCAAAGALPKAL